MDLVDQTKRYKGKLEGLLEISFFLLKITTGIWFFRIGQNLVSNQGGGFLLSLLGGIVFGYLGTVVIDGFSRSSLIFSTNAKAKPAFRQMDKKSPDRRFAIVAYRMGVVLLVLSGLFTILANSEVADMVLQAPPDDIVETKIQAVNKVDREKESTMQRGLSQAERNLNRKVSEGAAMVQRAISDGNPAQERLWRNGSTWIRLTTKNPGNVRFRNKILQAKKDSAQMVDEAQRELDQLQESHFAFLKRSTKNGEKIKEDLASYQASLIARAQTRNKMIQYSLGALDILWTVLILVLLRLLSLAGGVNIIQPRYSFTSIMGKASVNLRDSALGYVDRIVSGWEDRPTKTSTPEKRRQGSRQKNRQRSTDPKNVDKGIDEDVDETVDKDDLPGPSTDRRNAESQLPTGLHPDNESADDYSDNPDNEYADVDNGRQPIRGSANKSGTVILEGEVLKRSDTGEICVRHTQRFKNGNETERLVNLRDCQKSVGSYKSKIQKRDEEIKLLEKQLRETKEPMPAQAIEKKIRKKKESREHLVNTRNIWEGYIGLIESQHRQQTG